jgi:ribonucleoside-diphosphate reductase beta chain
MITGYHHFVTLADSLQWDETAVDLSVDIDAWPKLQDVEKDQLFGLIAGFCIA